MSPQFASDGKCVTTAGLEILVFCGFSTDKGPKNGGPLARQQWNSVLKTGCSIAVRASAVGTSERGVEHAGLDGVFTGGTTTSAPGM